jgi:hypothetical protein
VVWKYGNSNYKHTIKSSCFENALLHTFSGGSKVLYTCTGCACGIVDWSQSTLSYGQAWEMKGVPTLRTMKPGYNFCDFNCEDGLTRFDIRSNIDPRLSVALNAPQFITKPQGVTIGSTGLVDGVWQVIQGGSVTMWVDTPLAPIFSYSCPAGNLQRVMTIYCSNVTKCTVFANVYNPLTGSCYLAGDDISCAAGSLGQTIHQDVGCVVDAVKSEDEGGGGITSGSGAGGLDVDWGTVGQIASDVLDVVDPLAAIGLNLSNGDGGSGGLSITHVLIIVGIVLGVLVALAFVGKCALDAKKGT